MDGQIPQRNEIRSPGSATSIPSLLILDDDRPFLARLAKAMEARGYQVTTASSVDEGMTAIAGTGPDFAIIDVRLGDGNGLDVVTEIKRLHPATKALVLTGYGNIASAVSAIKRGAFDYLAKPADADEIDAALHGGATEKAIIPEHLMSADRVRWEHIQRIYEMCGRNVSETARRLNMHRRTLQRILAKRAPR